MYQGRQIILPDYLNQSNMANLSFFLCPITTICSLTRLLLQVHHCFSHFQPHHHLNFHLLSNICDRVKKLMKVLWQLHRLNILDKLLQGIFYSMEQYTLKRHLSP